MTANDVTNNILAKLPWYTIPASLANAAGQFYRFWANLPATTDGITAIEGFVRVTTVAINSIAPIIGASGVVLSIWMAGKYRIYKGGLDHELAMATLSKTPSNCEIQRLPVDFTLGGKAAKPDEPTVDLK